MCRRRSRCGQTGKGSRAGWLWEPHLGVDGEGKAPRTAAVHRHVGLLHAPALQADLQRGAALVRSLPCPGQSRPAVVSYSAHSLDRPSLPPTAMAFSSTMNKM